MRSGIWNWRAERFTSSRGRSEALVAPGLRLGGGLAKHEAADGHDEARHLGEGDELAGPHQAAVGMPPAHQGLDAQKACAPLVHDGLVVHLELAEAHRPPQRALERELLEGVVVHGRGVEAVGVASRLPWPGAWRRRRSGAGPRRGRRPPGTWRRPRWP